MESSIFRYLAEREIPEKTARQIFLDFFNSELELCWSFQISNRFFGNIIILDYHSVNKIKSFLNGSSFTFWTIMNSESLDIFLQLLLPHQNSCIFMCICLQLILNNTTFCFLLDILSIHLRSLVAFFSNIDIIHKNCLSSCVFSICNFYRCIWKFCLSFGFSALSTALLGWAASWVNFKFYL